MNIRRPWGCLICMRKARLISLLGFALLAAFQLNGYVIGIVIATVVVSTTLWLIHGVAYSVGAVSEEPNHSNSETDTALTKRRAFILGVMRMSAYVAVAAGVIAFGTRTARADPNQQVCCCDSGCLYDCGNTTRAHCHEIGGEECSAGRC